MLNILNSTVWSVDRMLIFNFSVKASPFSWYERMVGIWGNNCYNEDFGGIEEGAGSQFDGPQHRHSVWTHSSRSIANSFKDHSFNFWIHLWIIHSVKKRLALSSVGRWVKEPAFAIARKNQSIYIVQRNRLWTIQGTKQKLEDKNLSGIIPRLKDEVQLVVKGKS